MVCSIQIKKRSIQSSTLFRDLIADIKADYNLSRPGFNTWDDGETIYIPHPPALEQMHAHKLDMTMAELQAQGILRNTSTLLVIDKNVKGRMMLILEITTI